jgi:hypothetical protein
VPLAGVLLVSAIVQKVRAVHGTLLTLIPDGVGHANGAAGLEGFRWLVSLDRSLCTTLSSDTSPSEHKLSAL